MDNIVVLFGCLFDMNFNCLQICKSKYILVYVKGIDVF
jgi:hypothetical protein